jgi:putative ABC transport system ATP-binding protein
MKQVQKEHWLTNSKSTSEIMVLLAEINQSGMTILLLTHDGKVAGKTERVLFMLYSKIVAEKMLGKYIKDNGDTNAREE